MKFSLSLSAFCFFLLLLLGVVVVGGGGKEWAGGGGGRKGWGEMAGKGGCVYTVYTHPRVQCTWGVGVWPVAGARERAAEDDECRRQRQRSDRRRFSPTQRRDMAESAMSAGFSIIKARTCHLAATRHDLAASPVVASQASSILTRKEGFIFRVIQTWRPRDGWKEPEPDEATSHAASGQWLRDGDSLL